MVARRSRYLSGTSTHFAELEDRFLIMEGAPSWTEYGSVIAVPIENPAIQAREPAQV